MCYIRGAIYGCLIVALGVQAVVPCCVLTSTMTSSGSATNPCRGRSCCLKQHGCCAQHQDAGSEVPVSVPMKENGTFPKCPFCEAKVDWTPPDGSPLIRLQGVEQDSIPGKDAPLGCPAFVRITSELPVARGWLSRPIALGRLLI